MCGGIAAFFCKIEASLTGLIILTILWFDWQRLNSWFDLVFLWPKGPDGLIEMMTETTNSTVKIVESIMILLTPSNISKR